MRIVYFLLTHQLPELVERLVRVLLDETTDAFVVLHHDHAKAPLPQLRPSQVHVLADPVPTARGDMSFVLATQRGIDWIRANLAYDWVVHLSGQDYPLVHLSEMERTLSASIEDGYMRHVAPERAAAMCAERYLRRWYSWRLPWRRRKRITFSRPYNVIFSDSFRCYKGSQWWTLSRAALDYAADFLERTPRYWKQYERSFIPVESFLLTILLNSPLRIHPHHMRYIVWASPQSRHPEVLTVRDVPAMLASGDWFARKFNPQVCAEVLDRLDDHRRVPRSAAPSL